MNFKEKISRKKALADTSKLTYPNTNLPASISQKALNIAPKAKITYKREIKDHVSIEQLKNNIRQINDLDPMAQFQRWRGINFPPPPSDPCFGPHVPLPRIDFQDAAEGRESRKSAAP